LRYWEQRVTDSLLDEAGQENVDRAAEAVKRSHDEVMKQIGANEEVNAKLKNAATRMASAFGDFESAMRKSSGRRNGGHL